VKGVGGGVLVVGVGFRGKSYHRIYISAVVSGSVVSELDNWGGTLKRVIILLVILGFL
jgi:hypothetical protein